MNSLLTKATLIFLLTVLSGPFLFSQDNKKEGQKPAEGTAVRADASVPDTEALPKIAVLDFVTAGVTADLGESAAEILRTRLTETNDFTVVDRETLKRVLKGRTTGPSGAAGKNEAIALGRLLAVKNIVVGNVAKTGGMYTLTVRFIETETGQVVSGKIITAQSPDFCLEIVNHFSKEGFFNKTGKKTPAPRTKPAPAQAAVVRGPAPLPSGDITYAQVLEWPDDPELNYAYAKTQVRKGDLKGAAGTLERMLMVNPDLHNIRLLYAVVLYRLDNLGEAQSEFNIVKKKAPATLQAEAESYLKAIDKKQKPYRVSGGLSSGVEYDSNRNASPTSQKRLFLDSPLELTGSSRKRYDTSFLLVGNAELRRAIGSQKKHDLFGSVTYYRADQARVKSVNLQAWSFKLGDAYKAGRSELTPSLTYDRVLLDREKFLVNTGANLRLDRKINKMTGYWLETKYIYQDYISIPSLTSNPERQGGFYGLAAGAGRVLTPAMKLDAEMKFSRKRVKKRYNAYDEFVFGLRHSWLLGKGMFLLSSAYAGRDIYREADTVISRKKRKDDTFRGGLVAGLPLSTMYRGFSSLKDLTLTLNLEYSRSDSNILNYTYSNSKAVLLLNYRWQLGF